MTRRDLAGRDFGMAANGARIADHEAVFRRSLQEGTSMFQNLATRRRPPLSAVLFCSALTVAWWAGLCAYAGRAIWFW